jgi:phospholipid/cholesterol/gamma-HCH transport system permease protein
MLLVDAVRYIPYGLVTSRCRQDIVRLVYSLGIKSLGVISIVAAFTGMILALQTGIELSKFSQEEYIGAAVMVSMLREMGPFMTGLILAASVGSAIAAQMGTMTVSEEISALEVMSISPSRYLVMPRLLALTIITPLLAFYSSLLGLIGGGLVGHAQLGVSWYTYWDNATRFADEKDLWVGLIKALLFGIIIAIVSCYEGLTTEGGAVGVGLATRRSVIRNFLAILIVGYFITRLFY